MEKMRNVYKMYTTCMEALVYLWYYNDTLLRRSRSIKFYLICSGAGMFSSVFSFLRGRQHVCYNLGIMQCLLCNSFRRLPRLKTSCYVIWSPTVTVIFILGRPLSVVGRLRAYSHTYIHNMNLRGLHLTYKQYKVSIPPGFARKVMPYFNLLYSMRQVSHMNDRLSVKVDINLLMFYVLFVFS
jgi:hypothetical protein